MQPTQSHGGLVPGCMVHVESGHYQVSCMYECVYVCVCVCVCLAQVADYFLGSGQTLCVTGSLPQLGAWQQDHMLPLTGTHTQRVNFFLACSCHDALRAAHDAENETAMNGRRVEQVKLYMCVCVYVCVTPCV